MTFDQHYAFIEEGIKTFEEQTKKLEEIKKEKEREKEREKEKEIKNNDNAYNNNVHINININIPKIVKKPYFKIVKIHNNGSQFSKTSLNQGFNMLHR